LRSDPDLVRLKHMLDAVNEIIDFSTNKSRRDLDNDRKLSLSLVHLLEIVGEAASRISKEMRDEYDKIPWQSMIDMRNRLIHGYFDIDLDIVWKTVTKEIPQLKENLEIILKEKEESPWRNNK